MQTGINLYPQTKPNNKDEFLEAVVEFELPGPPKTRHQVKMTLWDSYETAANVKGSFERNASAILLCFDLQNQDSLLR